MPGGFVDWFVQVAALEIVGARVPRDPEQPGLEPPFVAPRRAVLQHTDEHVLHEVIGDRGVPRHPREEVEQRPVVPLEEDSKLGDVALAHRVHECLVGHSSVAV